MQKNNLKKVRFNGFHGIDVRKSKSGEESIYDINNLRICDDGTLKKRSGYKCVMSASANIRDVWSGTIDGKFTCVYLARENVYSLDVSTGISTYIMSTYTTSGPAQFFYYKGSLFLSDSEELYKVSNSYYHRPTGYVPLYGKDWPTTFYGEVNEPLNLLNGYARISYLVPEDYTARLPTKLSVRSVLSVYKNGELLDASQYSYDDTHRVISVYNLNPGDRLLATVIFNTDFSQSKLLKLPYVSIFGAVNNSRLFFWSPDESLVFPSAYVSPNDLKECEALFPDCTDLYFPEGHEFIVGDGKHGVKGMARHYDRLLMFTEGDAWMASTALTGKEDFPIMNINTSVGCAATLGTVTAKNSPFTIGKREIFQWNSDTDELNECNAFSISGPISEMLSSDFFESAIVFKDEYRNELWFHNPSVSGDVWVYNVDKKAWVRFSEIHANKFFDFNGEVGFIYENSIYAFDSNEVFDIIGVYAYDVNASVTTGKLDFGSKEPKKLSACSIDIDIPYTMTILTDQNEEISVTSTGKTTRNMKLKRLHSGRFFSIEKVVLSAKHSASKTIRSLEIYAR